jgi:hypothetical protein
MGIPLMLIVRGEGGRSKEGIGNQVGRTAVGMYRNPMTKKKYISFLYCMILHFFLLFFGIIYIKHSVLCKEKIFISLSICVLFFLLLYFTD